MSDHDLIIARVIAALEAEAIKAGANPDCLKAYNQSSYRARIFEVAKLFWKEGSRGNFATRMREVTKFGLRDAWDEGAKELGIPSDEYTEDDIKARDAIIEEEQSHIPDLLDYLDQLANTPETSLSAANSRLEIWANRYPDVVGRAKVEMGKDAKLEWVYGDTVHCNSCKRLNGIVKRASFWQRVGVLPKMPPNPKLQCGGWKCQCELRPTDKPLRRGRLPNLP